MASNSIAITGGYVVPVEGEPIDGGTVLLVDGKIAAVAAPTSSRRPVRTSSTPSGQWVLPGLVDAHTHLGAHEEGEGWAGPTPTS